MGNLVLRSGLTLEKGLISLWVRIPASTFAAAKANSNSGEYPIFDQVIPLITWGPQQIGTIYEFETPPIESQPPNEGPPFTFRLSFVSGSHKATTPPSYIGINVSGTPTVEVNIQSSNHPTTSGTNADLDSFTIDWDQAFISYGSSDSSYSDAGGCEYFGNSDYGIDGGFSGAPILLNPEDQWHHVLLSWDVSMGCAVHGSADPEGSTLTTLEGTTTACKMWFAIDDVSKSGADLPALWTGGGPNDMLSSTCSEFAGAVFSRARASTDFSVFPPVEIFTNYGQALVSVAEPIIPASIIAIPSELELQSTAGIVTPNLLIEVAELQIFDLSADVGSTAIRRLFIDQDGKPVKPAVAEKALGKPPILLHGTGNWKQGRNTGSLGGKFKPQGTINKYKPDPSLHGPQSPNT